MANSADSIVCAGVDAAVFCFALIGKVIIKKSDQPDSVKHDVNTH